MIDPGSRGLFQSDQGIHIIIANEGRITTMHPAHLIGLTFKRFHFPTFKWPLIPKFSRSILPTFHSSVLPSFHPLPNKNARNFAKLGVAHSGGKLV
jgi:hypothetical protein